MPKDISPGPDVIEAGRVMAELNDWRAITFVLVLVIAILLLERLWSQRDMRLERREMKEIARSFADSAGAVAEALATLRTEVTVLRITSARMESREAAQKAESTDELRT